MKTLFHVSLFFYLFVCLIMESFVSEDWHLIELRVISFLGL